MVQSQPQTITMIYSISANEEVCHDGEGIAGNSSVTASDGLTIAHAHQGQFMEAPGFLEILSKPRLDQYWSFHVHIDRFEIAGLVDKSDAELVEWLEARWMVKSSKLEHLQSDLKKGRV